MTDASTTPRGSRARGFFLVSLAYITAAAAAYGAGWAVRGEPTLLVIAVADVVATLVVFGFSVGLNNSSVYDPYWSVAPLPIAAFLLATAPEAVPAPRQILVTGLITLWGLRLTWNWARGWPGLHHEDWRYLDIRGWSGRFYWPASLLTIHLMPTAWVFGGLLSAWVALKVGTRPLGWLDGLAALCTLGAIAVEAQADRELARFKARGPAREEILESGIWRLSRHPNYFGEVSFWWGLYLFALAADPTRWWVVVGPLCLTALFAFISLPLIEKRMVARRPHYADRVRRVSAIVPWFPRS